MSHYPVILKDDIQIGVYKRGNCLYPIITSERLHGPRTDVGGNIIDTDGYAGMAYAPMIACDSGPCVIGGLLVPTIRDMGGKAFGALLSVYEADGIVCDKEHVYAICGNECKVYCIEDPDIPQRVFEVKYELPEYKEDRKMVDLISCGVYVEDGVMRPILCDPEMGDIIIQLDAGPILLENVIVTQPRFLDESDIAILTGPLNYYKADGIFGTTTEWAAICGNEVQFYAYNNPTVWARKVPTSFDISYEED